MLGEWWAIGLVAVLLVVEIVADKVPAVDHVNDAIQTVVRPAAGGLLAVSASGEADASSIALLVAGVLIAGGVHSVKATTRPVVNASTAGVGAPVVSTIEDILALIMTVLAIVVPILAALALIALVVAALLLVRKWKRRQAGPSPAHARPLSSPRERLARLVQPHPEEVVQFHAALRLAEQDELHRRDRTVAVFLRPGRA